MINIGCIGENYYKYSKIIKKNTDITSIYIGEEKDCETGIIKMLDMLILEVKKDKLKDILKCIFRIRCENEFTILAIVSGCGDKEKLLLSDFGVNEYIEGNENASSIEERINMIIASVAAK